LPINILFSNCQVARKKVNLKIDGNAVSDGGDIAAIIYKQGLNVEELISALKSAFPKNDPRPEQFRLILEEIYNYHNTIYEWKELHNALDDVLSSFGQFYAEIQRADAEHILPRVRSLRSLWRAVSVSVDALVEFSRGIKEIGIPYMDKNDGLLIGEPWVIRISALRRQIDIQLGVSASLDNLSGPADRIIQSSQFRIGIRPGWWVNLFELSNEFNHTTYKYMHITDKKLRESVGELYMYSKSLFGSWPNETI